MTKFFVKRIVRNWVGWTICGICVLALLIEIPIFFGDDRLLESANMFVAPFVTLMCFSFFYTLVFTINFFSEDIEKGIVSLELQNGKSKFKTYFTRVAFSSGANVIMIIGLWLVAVGLFACFETTRVYALDGFAASIGTLILLSIFLNVVTTVTTLIVKSYISSIVVLILFFIVMIAPVFSQMGMASLGSNIDTNNTVNSMKYFKDFQDDKVAQAILNYTKDEEFAADFKKHGQSDNDIDEFKFADNYFYYFNVDPKHNYNKTYPENKILLDDIVGGMSAVRFLEYTKFQKAFVPIAEQKIENFNPGNNFDMEEVWNYQDLSDLIASFSNEDLKSSFLPAISDPFSGDELKAFLLKCVDFYKDTFQHPVQPLFGVRIGDLESEKNEIYRHCDEWEINGKKGMSTYVAGMLYSVDKCFKYLFTGKVDFQEPSFSYMHTYTNGIAGPHSIAVANPFTWLTDFEYGAARNSNYYWIVQDTFGTVYSKQYLVDSVADDEETNGITALKYRVRDLQYNTSYWGELAGFVVVDVVILLIAMALYNRKVYR
jgi:hypothetical protein